MEDEVQLQSLAKRLINIYNACKWSKSKLHIRKKKRFSRNTQDSQHFEEYTEIETGSSARTVFVYNRNNKKIKEDSQLIESTVLAQYSEIKQERTNQITDNFHNRYCNDQSVNVCSCKKCCCDPGKQGTYNQARKSFENKKKSNSKLAIYVKPTEKQESAFSNKQEIRGCCCPACAPQNHGNTPPVRKKSSIKMHKPSVAANNEHFSQASAPLHELHGHSPSPSRTSEQFFSHYPPPSPPSKPSKITKETNCGLEKKCCECPPIQPAQNASFCCQCTPLKQEEGSCHKSECCKCPPSQPKTSDCCQCILPPPPPTAASFGCQCHCPPSPVSLCCCDFDELSPQDNNHCCCQSVDTNNATVVCTDKIIIPTYFNEGEHRTPSGNLSLAVSEEVKNVLMYSNSSDQQKYDSSDKQISTSGDIIRSGTSSAKKNHSAEMLATHHVPPRGSRVPQSVKDCNHQNCQCHQKELHDRMINTSCVIVRSCTPPNSRHEHAGHLANHSSQKKCDDKCCKCPRNGHHDRIPEVHSPRSPTHPEHHVQPHDVIVHSPSPPVHHAASPPIHPEHHDHHHNPEEHHIHPRNSIHPEHHDHHHNPEEHHIHPRNSIHPEHHDHHHNPEEHHIHPRNSIVHSPSPPMHPRHHVDSLSPLLHPEHHDHPHNPVVHSPSGPTHQEHHGQPHNPIFHSPSGPIHHDYHVQPRNSIVHSPSPPVHRGHHVDSPSPLMHPEHHGRPRNSIDSSPSPPMHQRHHIDSPSLLVHPEHHAHPHSPNDPVHQEHHDSLRNSLGHSLSPPMHPEHHAHPHNAPVHHPDHVIHQPGPHHNPAMHPVITDNNVIPYSPTPEQGINPPSATARQPYSNSLYPPTEEERMVANYSPQPFSGQMYPSYGGQMANQMSPVPADNIVPPPLYGGMVPPRRMDFTGPLLRSQSTPICCKQVPKGQGDQKIAGINVETEDEIYATLQKIELSLRDEADSHSRNMRCIVDQVCRQAGQIKELKVLVTGVVEEKRAPTCKEVEKKIRKLEKRKEKSGAAQREYEMRERERRKKEGKGETGSLEDIPSNLCCKCGEKHKKRPMGCCGKCCAKRCRGCCGRCCNGCCPKCCNCCCAPCEKCCPTCCCGFAKCCDTCWSCRWCPRRKKKCHCSK